VFVGGCTLTAAEAVAGAGRPDASLDVINGMASLVDKSLLRQEEENGELRFKMLETLREYALECLTAAGEADRFARAHADYYLEFAEQAEPGLHEGWRQAEWLERLTDDHDNLRAALSWFVRHGPTDHGLRLAGALRRFWRSRGYFAEGREWTSSLLALPGARGRTAARARALYAAGGFANQQGDYVEARALFQESLDIYRELGDIHGIGWGLVYLGILSRYEGNHAAARSLLEESLGLVKKAGDIEAMAAVLGNLGMIARDEGAADVAETHLGESLGLWRKLGDRVGIGWALTGLAMVARAQGKLDVAVARTEESLALWRELGDRQNTANVLSTAARLALDQGEHAVARAREGSPDVRVQPAAAEAAAAQWRLARRLRAPSLGLNVGADWSDPTQEGTNTFAGVSLAIPIAGSASAAVAAGERDHQTALLEQARRLAAVAAEAAWGATRVARLRFEAIDHDVLPAARQAADLTRLAYREGKVDVFRLLDAERLLSDTQAARADAYEAWGTAHADLLRATARDGP